MYAPSSFQGTQYKYTYLFDNNDNDNDNDNNEIQPLLAHHSTGLAAAAAFWLLFLIIGLFVKIEMAGERGTDCWLVR